MANISGISFQNVGRSDGCCCDRCGQYIRNIWTVNYTDGSTLNYGIDCFEKVQKSGLNAQGIKMMNKILKSIQSYSERLAKYVSGEMTEENDESWKAEQADWNRDSYWHGREFGEYKEWLINEFFPYRISECQKDLARFRRINFTK